MSLLLHCIHLHQKDFSIIVEERIGNQIIDIISFDVSIKNTKELITFFKDENRKSRMFYMK